MPVKKTFKEKNAQQDLLVIIIVSIVVLIIYNFISDFFVIFIHNTTIHILARLLVAGSIQFSLAGLAPCLIMLFRKEKFSIYGLVSKHILSSIIGCTACFIPYIL